MTFLHNDDVGKLLLRLTLGLLMLPHGIAKLIGGVGGIQGMLAGAGLPEFLAFGVYIGEVVAPLMIIAGWFCGVGALLIVINMLFAIFLAHSHEIFMLGEHGGWAIELQAFFLFTAVVLLFTGPGRIGMNRS
ncbi:DoxX family protein [Aquisalimonas asiatica]|uniref:Putative oxidoreductase n=1 Tax=Aquisalimonas asiatica TaxID=406100 RepID=A0A1H8RPI7_9GAMM|nr:DoxX family protein [Aquisalimonas asiatica]SEO68252.1 putative oxidoreductase [Aquisalimonas asiatica]